MFTTIFTYEPIERYVLQKLNEARQAPYAMVDIYESQAFGVVQFVTSNCYKVQPELENRLIKMWDEWREMFWDIRCKKLEDA
jgi:hypothetical protein